MSSATTVPAGQGRAAVGNPLDVAEHRLYFAGAADLNQTLACTRHNASTEGLDDRVAVLGANHSFHPRSFQCSSLFTMIGKSTSVKARVVHVERFVRRTFQRAIEHQVEEGCKIL